MRYDYGVPGRGYSYEHQNFYGTLSTMPDVDVLYFPFDVHLRENGRESMNLLLLRTVDEYNPDLCFLVLFTDEIKIETLLKIKSLNTCIVMNWFCDDHWRFGSFSKYYAPALHWIVTTDRNAVGKYETIGCRNIILSQWGYNHHLYLPQPGDHTYEVTFVGKAHSSRKKIIKKLTETGMSVKCWGQGWEHGRVSFDEMIRIYSNSAINLNFTESSMRWGLVPIAKVFLTRRADDTYRVNRYREFKGNLSVLLNSKTNQIKGRNFEIPGTGGFLLTEYVDNIEEYFVPDKQITVFKSPDELTDKVRYYLEHDSEREAIRRAGYDRALRDHTFERRFSDIFRKIGLNDS
jgi:spore maturation protein CgeB